MRVYAHVFLYVCDVYVCHGCFICLIYYLIHSAVSKTARNDLDLYIAFIVCFLMYLNMPHTLFTV